LPNASFGVPAKVPPTDRSGLGSFVPYQMTHWPEVEPIFYYGINLKTVPQLPGHSGRE
jgi:hypothetical protein